MNQYVAIIHKDADSDYGLSFPDFPGCISAGSTVEEARRMGAEALSFHIEGVLEDGLQIPEPSQFSALMADPQNQDGIAVLIRAKRVSSADPRSG